MRNKMKTYLHIDNTTRNSDFLQKQYTSDLHLLQTSYDKVSLYTMPKDVILVKENCQSSDFLRLYFKYFNPDKNFCSHILLMENDYRKFILTDAALNINPSLKDLVKITQNAIKFWTSLDKNILTESQPIHINFLSNSGHLELGNQTACNCQLLKDYFEQTACENLYTTWQLDTCLYDKSRVKKAGELSYPDIIVVPNLDTGNAIYKALMYQYNCYGFIFGGTTPAILNSRSDLDKNAESIKILNKVMSNL